MTPLASVLARRIRQTGPITVAEFMSECLTHPEHGYYTGRDPLGTAGDFTTAPEISQMFGELIGLCLAETWNAQGRPDPFTLAELGPGRGTLMADIVRATERVAGFRKAMRISLVEVSQPLVQAQARALEGVEVAWHNSAAELDATTGPLFVVANEFFDALPIRQFTRQDQGWAERMICLDGDAQLAFGLSPAAPLAELTHRLGNTNEGEVVEVSGAARAAVSFLAGQIAQRGGALLIIDYGDWRSRGDTLQAVADHQYADPLATPGQADLTAHVDFEALAEAATATGASHSAMIPQGAFLHRLGIGIRAQVLAQGLSGAALETHLSSFRRLTAPEEMGTLFKAMAIYPQHMPPPPGLTT